MDIIGFIESITGILNTVLLLVMAVAFVAFLFNAYRFFIAESASPEAQEKAKQFALYSIIGFVFVLSLWGIVRLLGEGLFGDSSFVPCPDAFDGNTYARDLGDCVSGGGSADLTGPEIIDKLPQQPQKTDGVQFDKLMDPQFSDFGAGEPERIPQGNITAETKLLEETIEMIKLAQSMNTLAISMTEAITSGETERSSFIDFAYTDTLKFHTEKMAEIEASASTIDADANSNEYKEYLSAKASVERNHAQFLEAYKLYDEHFTQ